MRNAAPDPPPARDKVDAPETPPGEPTGKSAAEPPPEQKAAKPDAVPAPDTGCLAALVAMHGGGVRAAEIKPGQEAACSVVQPIVVEALTVRMVTGPMKITLQPPATLSCAMATSVALWLETSVQPLAKGYFARDMTTLRVGGGHECRRRNRSANGPLSEHSTGQALDIFAFVIGDGKSDGTVVVEKPDGATQERFLAAIRQSACGAFMTSLGPGSDAAHANHLHIDIQPRRASSSRFCQ